MRRGPTPTIVSNLDLHSSVPTSPSSSEVSLLELARRDTEPEVWNEIILAHGKVNSSSICGSAPDRPGIGRLAARRGTGIAGVDGAIAASAVAIVLLPDYHDRVMRHWGMRRRSRRRLVDQG